jgi:serine phosphatase RsbU (regulator of sigma subunit)/CheY-like chemotaxis protein
VFHLSKFHFMKSNPTVLKYIGFLIWAIFFLVHPPLYSQDISTLQKDIEKYQSEGNKINLANTYNKLGHAYWQQQKLTEAINSFEQSISLNKELNNKNAQRIINGYLGLIYLENEQHQEAIEAFENSLAMNIASKKWQEAISDYYNIASAYQTIENYNKSNEFAQKALDKSIEINNLESAKSCNLLMANNYEKLGNNKKASEHFSNYNTLVKHLQQKQVAQLETEKTKIQSEKQQVEKDLKTTSDKVKEVTAEKEQVAEEKEQIVAEKAKSEIELEKQKQKTQKNIRYFVSIIGFILVILLLFYFQNRHRKKVNRKLKEQNAEIEKQKDEIEKQRDLANKQRKNLTSSIQYARRIQSAVIPRPEALFEHFRDSFILYKPRDIVSGDFYWLAQKDNLIVIAGADCTGHGVPGAFMSLLGVAYLNEIVNKIAINMHINSLSADEILNQLREKVISSLHQSESKRDPKDGMDIALCIVDLDTKKMQYAGAYNPLIIVRKGKIIEYKGDKMPVSFHRRMHVPFTSHEINLQPNDCIYIFSDGYVDQFGGEDGHKYLMKRFTQKLVDIHQKPMQEQKQILEDEFNNWRGEYGQIDDVLVMGFRFGGEIDTRLVNWTNKTILIAEDTDINYFLLLEVLKKTKATIIRVKNGAEAIEFVKTNHIDLVLMDINMPTMDGYEATKLIKEYNDSIPIIIQTAVYEDGKESSIKAGADDFISKPINLKSFMEKLSRFLN